MAPEGVTDADTTAGGVTDARLPQCRLPLL